MREELIEILTDERCVEYVGYDGKYPNFCSGELTVRVREKLIKFKGLHYNDDLNLWELRIDFYRGKIDTRFESPDFIDSVKSLDLVDILIINELINENIFVGHCGGCR